MATTGLLASAQVTYYNMATTGLLTSAQVKTKAQKPINKSKRIFIVLSHFPNL
jgi:hypothetical protein